MHLNGHKEETNVKKHIFTGAGVAIVTPMFPDGSIHYEKLGELIDWQIACGTDAIVICGTTGESACMTDNEHVDCIAFAVKRAAGRVPVIAGAGSNDTRYAEELSKEAKNLGVDALLHVTPYYNKTSQRGLLTHFTKIADATDLPVILYNVPSRTGAVRRCARYLLRKRRPDCADPFAWRQGRHFRAVECNAQGSARHLRAVS